MKFLPKLPMLTLLLPALTHAHKSTNHSPVQITPISITSTPSSLTTNINQTNISQPLPLAILIDNTPLVFQVQPTPTFKCRSRTDWLREIQFFTRFLLTSLLAHLACHIFCEILDFEEGELLRSERRRLKGEKKKLKKRIRKWEKERKGWRKEQSLLEKAGLRKEETDEGKSKNVEEKETKGSNEGHWEGY